MPGSVSKIGLTPSAATYPQNGARNVPVFLQVCDSPPQTHQHAAAFSTDPDDDVDDSAKAHIASAAGAKTQPQTQNATSDSPQPPSQPQSSYMPLQSRDNTVSDEEKDDDADVLYLRDQQSHQNHGHKKLSPFGGSHQHTNDNTSAIPTHINKHAANSSPEQMLKTFSFSRSQRNQVLPLSSSFDGPITVQSTTIPQLSTISSLHYNSQSRGNDPTNNHAANNGEKQIFLEKICQDGGKAELYTYHPSSNRRKICLYQENQDSDPKSLHSDVSILNHITDNTRLVGEVQNDFESESAVTPPSTPVLTKNPKSRQMDNTLDDEGDYGIPTPLQTTRQYESDGVCLSPGMSLLAPSISFLSSKRERNTPQGSPLAVSPSTESISVSYNLKVVSDDDDDDDDESDSFSDQSSYFNPNLYGKLPTSHLQDNNELSPHADQKDDDTNASIKSSAQFHNVLSPALHPTPLSSSPHSSIGELSSTDLVQFDLIRDYAFTSPEVHLLALQQASIMAELPLLLDATTPTAIAKDILTDYKTLAEKDQQPDGLLTDETATSPEALDNTVTESKPLYERYPTKVLSRNYLPLWMSFISYMTLFSATDTLGSLTGAIFRSTGLLSSAMTYIVVIAMAFVGPILTDRFNPLRLTACLSFVYTAYIACHFHRSSVVAAGFIIGLGGMMGFCNTLFLLANAGWLAEQDYLAYLRNTPKETDENDEQACEEQTGEAQDKSAVPPINKATEQYIKSVTDQNGRVIRCKLSDEEQARLQLSQDHIIGFSTSWLSVMSNIGSVLGCIVGFCVLYFGKQPGETLNENTTIVRSLFIALLCVSGVGNALFFIAAGLLNKHVFTPVESESQLEKEEREMNKELEAPIARKKMNVSVYLRTTLYTAFLVMKSKALVLNTWSIFCAYSIVGFVTGTFVARSNMSEKIGLEFLTLFNAMMSCFGIVAGFLLSRFFVINSPMKSRIFFMVGICLQITSLLIIKFYSTDYWDTIGKSWGICTCLAFLVGFSSTFTGCGLTTLISFMAYTPTLRAPTFSLVSIIKSLGLFTTFMIAVYVNSLTTQIYILLGAFALSLALQVISMITQWALPVDEIQEKVSTYKSSLELNRSAQVSDASDLDNAASQIITDQEHGGLNGDIEMVRIKGHVPNPSHDHPTRLIPAEIATQFFPSGRCQLITDACENSQLRDTDTVIHHNNIQTELHHMRLLQEQFEFHQAMQRNIRPGSRHSLSRPHQQQHQHVHKSSPSQRRDSQNTHDTKRSLVACNSFQRYRMNTASDDEQTQGPNIGWLDDELVLNSYHSAANSSYYKIHRDKVLHDDYECHLPRNLSQISQLSTHFGPNQARIVNNLNVIAQGDYFEQYQLRESLNHAAAAGGGGGSATPFFDDLQNSHIRSHFDDVDRRAQKLDEMTFISNRLHHSHSHHSINMPHDDTTSLKSHKHHHVETLVQAPPVAPPHVAGIVGIALTPYDGNLNFHDTSSVYTCDANTNTSSNYSNRQNRQPLPLRHDLHLQPSRSHHLPGSDRSVANSTTDLMTELGSNRYHPHHNSLFHDTMTNLSTPFYNPSTHRSNSMILQNPNQDGTFCTIVANPASPSIASYSDLEQPNSLRPSPLQHENI